MFVGESLLGMMFAFSQFHPGTQATYLLDFGYIGTSNSIQGASAGMEDHPHTYILGSVLIFRFFRFHFSKIVNRYFTFLVIDRFDFIYYYFVHLLWSERRRRMIQYPEEEDDVALDGSFTGGSFPGDGETLEGEEEHPPPFCHFVGGCSHDRWGSPPRPVGKGPRSQRCGSPWAMMTPAIRSKSVEVVVPKYQC